MWMALVLGTAFPCRIRVCTSGGEGVCSSGAGASTLAALRFLAPREGVELTGCSCLAQCDRGVVLQLQDSGEFVHRVNDAAAAAAVIRRAGFPVDNRLVDAFTSAALGDELAAAGKLTDALNAYNGAFGLSVAAGIGMQWRSLPSSVLRLRQRLSQSSPITPEQVSQTPCGPSPARSQPGRLHHFPFIPCRWLGSPD